MEDFIAIIPLPLILAAAFAVFCLVGSVVALWIAVRGPHA